MTYLYADTNDLKSKVLSDIGDDEVFDSIRTNVDVMGQTAPTDDARDELFDEILVTSINPSGASCSTSPTTSRAGSTSSTTSRAEVPATTSAQSATAASGQSMPSRRLALLAKKRQQFRPSAPTIVTFQSRLTEEFERYSKMLPVEQECNPLNWWRDHQQEYPLMSLYVKSNFSFQPTSVASESVFNDDKEVYDVRRKAILPGRGEGLVVAQNFIKNRANEEQFRLCKQCPAPQNNGGGAKYKIMCPQHQKV